MGLERRVSIFDLDFNDSDDDEPPIPLTTLDDIPLVIMNSILVLADSIHSRAVCFAWSPIRATSALMFLSQFNMTTELDAWFGYQRVCPSEDSLSRALKLAIEMNGLGTSKLILSRFTPTYFNAHASFNTAATRGLVKAIDLLLAATPDAQAILAANQFNLIHMVARTGNLKMTSHLLQCLTESARGECLRSNQRLFMDALNNGQAGIVRLLLSASGPHGPYIEIMRHYWLDDVIKRDHVELAKLIVEEVDVPSHKRHDMATQLLIRACSIGHVPLVAHAIDFHGNRHKRIHAEEDQAIRLAAHFGHTEIVRIILDRTDFIEETIRTVDDAPIRFAARNGHTGTLKLLLSNVSAPMACLRSMDNFALHWSIRNNHRSTIALIVKEGRFKKWEIAHTKASVSDAIRAMQYLVIPTHPHDARTRTKNTAKKPQNRG
jgi:ankyrin repeat protein